MISLKTFVITISILVVIIIGVYFYQQNEFNNLVEEIQDDVKIEKEIIKEEKNQVILKRDSIIKSIKAENEEILIQSKKLYEELQRKNRNPIYDFNFLQSADVISKSNYKSGE